MATAGRGTPAPVGGGTELRTSEAGPRRNGGARPDGAAPAPESPPRPQTLTERLFAEPYAFDFFQAVRLLERLDASKKPVGRAVPPRNEIVRFRAHLSLSFPPSSIYDLTRPTPAQPVPQMVVAFLGLTGPSGVLPRHYTELLLRLEKESKGAEKHALRDWFDLFNHRMVSLFYRAWEKYRFYIPYERGEYDRPEPDPFTRSLFSLIGLGTPPLRNRLQVAFWKENDQGEPERQVLARIDDLALLHYSGFLAHRPRCALSLQALLQDYFEMPVEVQQFRGQWLWLEPASQSRIGADGGNNQLGVNLVAGERVWDVQSRFRVRLGPLGYAQFSELLPDRSPVADRKTLFLVIHLVRQYVGAEFDFDVQLVLKADEVPECRLAADGGIGPRLGWNTWVRSQPLMRVAAKRTRNDNLQVNHSLWGDSPWHPRTRELWRAS